MTGPCEGCGDLTNCVDVSGQGPDDPDATVRLICRDCYFSNEEPDEDGPTHCPDCYASFDAGVPAHTVCPRCKRGMVTTVELTPVRPVPPDLPCPNCNYELDAHEIVVETHCPSCNYSRWGAGWSKYPDTSTAAAAAV
jgi:predicted Zn-ribbon and HTH transcriptional regulator